MSWVEALHTSLRHLAFFLGMFLWNEAQQFASAPLTVVDVVAWAISSCRHGLSARPPKYWSLPQNEFVWKYAGLNSNGLRGLHHFHNTPASMIKHQQSTDWFGSNGHCSDCSYHAKSQPKVACRLMSANWNVELCWTELGNLENTKPSGWGNPSYAEFSWCHPASW